MILSRVISFLIFVIVMSLLELIGNITFDYEIKSDRLSGFLHDLMLKSIGAITLIVVCLLMKGILP